MNANLAMRDASGRCAIYRRRLRMETLEDRRLLAGDFELLKDLSRTPILEGINARNFASAGGIAYFAAKTPSFGFELWRSDGTPAGTYQLRDINPGTFSSMPQLITPVGNSVYFVVNDGVNRHQQLWTSDGTAAGTHLVAAVSNASSSPDPPFAIGAVGDDAYFLIFGLSSQWELWKTQGDEVNTELVKTFGDDFNFNNIPQGFAAIGDTLFFSVVDGTPIW